MVQHVRSSRDTLCSVNSSRSLCAHLWTPEQYGANRSLTQINPKSTVSWWVTSPSLQLPESLLILSTIASSSAREMAQLCHPD